MDDRTFRKFAITTTLILSVILGLMCNRILIRHDIIVRLLFIGDQRDIASLYDAVATALPRNDPALDWVQVVVTQSGTEVRAHFKGIYKKEDTERYIASLAKSTSRAWKPLAQHGGYASWITERRYYHSYLGPPGLDDLVIPLIPVVAVIFSLCFAMVAIFVRSFEKWKMTKAKYAILLIYVGLVEFSFFIFIMSFVGCDIGRCNLLLDRHQKAVQTIEDGNTLDLNSLINAESKHFDLVYGKAPLYDDFYLRMGTILVQPASTDTEPLRVRIAYDLSFEPSCGYDGLVEKYITPK